ncbi:hypothetical protein [Bradyrhizobium sp. HKCCYLS20291]|uniref:hypothetical protein n=1 Tax=Bradyrhizobium sp. HKCCYLS20291 TaxID=3420766 RepID=UPI003EB98D28
MARRDADKVRPPFPRIASSITPQLQRHGGNARDHVARAYASSWPLRNIARRHRHLGCGRTMSVHVRCGAVSGIAPHYDCRDDAARDGPRSHRGDRRRASPGCAKAAAAGCQRRARSSRCRCRVCIDMRAALAACDEVCAQPRRDRFTCVTTFRQNPASRLQHSIFKFERVGIATRISYG